MASRAVDKPKASMGSRKEGRKSNDHDFRCSGLCPFLREFYLA